MSRGVADHIYTRRLPKALIEYKGIHKGERCFLLACGPSLLECLPGSLANEYKIAVNHAINRFPDSQYSVIGDLKNGLEIDTRESILFSSQEPQCIPAACKIKDLGHLPGWSWDLEQGGYFGHTSTYLALQVAAYLGFNPVYLCGLDLCDTEEATHFYGFRAWQKKSERDRLFEAMIHSFEWAQANELDGNLQVFNCHLQSALRCFPFVTLEGAISG